MRLLFWSLIGGAAVGAAYALQSTVAAPPAPPQITPEMAARLMRINKFEKVAILTTAPPAAVS